MRKYSITADRILRHYDVTRKVCPAPFVYDINDWENFKNKLADDDTKRNEEMIERIKINVNGKEYAVNRILKDGKNFICLADMKQAGFDVGFNERTKVPSFGVSVSEDNIIIAGKDVTVHKILKSNENYIRLRDLKDILNIDYDNANKKVIVDVK